MGSNPLPDTFFSIKFKDFFKEKFIEMISLKLKEHIKPRKFKKIIFLIGHSYTTVLGLSHDPWGPEPRKYQY